MATTGAAGLVSGGYVSGGQPVGFVSGGQAGYGGQPAGFVSGGAVQGGYVSGGAVGGYSSSGLQQPAIGGFSGGLQQPGLPEGPLGAFPEQPPSLGNLGGFPITDAAPLGAWGAGGYTAQSQTISSVPGI